MLQGKNSIVQNNPSFLFYLYKLTWNCSSWLCDYDVCIEVWILVIYLLSNQIVRHCKVTLICVNEVSGAAKVTLFALSEIKSQRHLLIKMLFLEEWLVKMMELAEMDKLTALIREMISTFIADWKPLIDSLHETEKVNLWWLYRMGYKKKEVCSNHRGKLIIVLITAVQKIGSYFFVSSFFFLFLLTFSSCTFYFLFDFSLSFFLLYISLY